MTFSEASACLEGPIRSDVNGRLLRARALLNIKSYDLARAELEEISQEELAPLLAARVQTDLVYLAYYFGRAPEAQPLFDAARPVAERHPLVLADLYLALSVCAIADNDVRKARNAVAFADDALRSAGKGPRHELLRCRIDGQYAHLLAQAGEYAEGARYAQDGRRRSASFDLEEQARATYVYGFAAWCWGRTSESFAALSEAEEALRQSKTALWRWILLCLARVTSDLDDYDKADAYAAQSTFDAPEEYAFIALRAGGITRARHIFDLARAPGPGEGPFRDAVDAILKLHEGHPRDAYRILETVSDTFASAGLHHYELGASVHAAFAQDEYVPGAGRRRGVATLTQLQNRGATSFAWYEPRVAAWAARLAAGQPDLSQIAHALRPKNAAPVSDLVSRCRAAGLTWREVEIFQAISTQAELSPHPSRTSLAKALGISASTLRVHLWRIREKLEVDGRGDAAIAAALDRSV